MIGAGGVLLGDELPGVDLGLLHAEADLLLVLVDVEDDDLDLLAGLTISLGWLMRLGPAHLGDVDEALDALLELGRTRRRT
jgi:hypothetical protein